MFAGLITKMTATAKPKTQLIKNVFSEETAAADNRNLKTYTTLCFKIRWDERRSLATGSEFGELFQQTNIGSVLMGGCQIGELFGELLADALLLQQIDQQVVQVAIEHIAGNGVDLIVPLALEDGHFIDGEDVVWKEEQVLFMDNVGYRI